MHYIALERIHSKIVKNSSYTYMKEVDTLKNISIIGFGEIGSRLGARLIQYGYKIFVYDTNEEAKKLSKKIGGENVASPAEAAEKSNFIIICVTDEMAVKECVLGEQGLIQELKKNSIIIDMTTSLPDVTIEINNVIKSKNSKIIDAPVSRGTYAAENGTLSILIGGDKTTIKECMPILETLGTDIIHVGKLGSGHAVKVINMMMMSCNLLAATEIITLGQKKGIEIKRMLEVINQSSGESYVTSYHFKEFVINDSFNSKFSIGLMKKDISLALKLAESLDLEPFSGRRTNSLYNALSNKGHDDLDNMEVVNLWRERMGGI